MSVHASAAIATAIALAGLAFVARPRFGVAPRTIFALAFALGLTATTMPSGVAALVASILLVVLGAITTSVDRAHIRAQRDWPPPPDIGRPGPPES